MFYNDKIIKMGTMCYGLHETLNRYLPIISNYD